MSDLMSGQPNEQVDFHFDKNNLKFIFNNLFIQNRRHKSKSPIKMFRN